MLNGNTFFYSVTFVIKKAKKWEQDKNVEKIELKIEKIGVSPLAKSTRIIIIIFSIIKQTNKKFLFYRQYLQFYIVYI